MNRKRAIQNQSLFATMNTEAINPIPSAVKLTASSRYIPVYHVELVRDRSIKAEPRPSIHNPDDVVAILQDELLTADREKLVCLMLNAKNVVIGMDIVSVGSLTSSVAHPRLCVAAHNRGLASSYVSFPQITGKTRTHSARNHNINIDLQCFDPCPQVSLFAVPQPQGICLGVESWPKFCRELAQNLV